MDNIYVTNVKYLGSFILLCTFNSGITKKVDMKPLFDYPAYKELSEENKFLQFGLDETIFWSNGTDISPEWLYANGKDV